MDHDSADIARARAGDRRGFESLLSRYRDYVFTIARRVLHDEQWAEEAAQDAFVKAFQHLDTFRGDAKFSTWIYRIAWTTAISKLRSERRHRADDLEGAARTIADGGADGFTQVEASERRRVIDEALDRLKPEESLALSLFYLQDRPLAEIAEIVGDTVNTVKVRLFRARKRLGAMLEGQLLGELNEL